MNIDYIKDGFFKDRDNLHFRHARMLETFLFTVSQDYKVLNKSLIDSLKSCVDESDVQDFEKKVSETKESMGDFFSDYYGRAVSDFRVSHKGYEKFYNEIFEHMEKLDK